MLDAGQAAVTDSARFKLPPRAADRAAPDRAPGCAAAPAWELAIRFGLDRGLSLRPAERHHRQGRQADRQRRAVARRRAHRMGGDRRIPDRTVLGSAAGLALWLVPTGAAVLRPYLVALNGLPKIALAPLIIVWFGIGISSKIAIAAIITFIVAVITALQGAKEVDADLVKLLPLARRQPSEDLAHRHRARRDAVDRSGLPAQCRLRADRAPSSASTSPPRRASAT